MHKLRDFGLAALLVAALAGCGGGGGGVETSSGIASPAVTSTDPADGATGVALDASVTVTFSQPMDAATLAGAAFTVAAGDVPVAGAVRSSGATATFTPSGEWAPETTYTATIGASATSATGAALAAAHTFSFRTRSLLQMGGARQGQTLALAGTIGTLAGAPVPGADGVGPAARFDRPGGVATDGVSLYVADTGNHTIRKIVIATGAVSTVAGATGVPGDADGTGTAARLRAPAAITSDGTNLFVADSGNYLIRKIVLATGEVSTLAGTTGTRGSADGTGTAAAFSELNGLATDGTNLYATDTGNQTLRRIVIATGAVSTLAGSAGTAGSTDATGTAARFDAPTGIAYAGGNLFVTEVGNQPCAGSSSPRARSRPSPARWA